VVHVSFEDVEATQSGRERNYPRKPSAEFAHAVVCGVPNSHAGDEFEPGGTIMGVLGGELPL